MHDGLRSHDLVIRYGGDEFVCAMPDLSLDVASLRIAEVQLRLAAAEPAVTVSVGLVQLEDDEDLEHVLERADGDLYRARASCRPVRSAGSDDAEAA